MLNYMHTAGGLHLIINGQPVTVAKSDANYEAVVKAIGEKASPETIMDILEAEKRRFEAAVQVVQGIELKGGELYHEGERIDGVLGTRMKAMLDEGFDLKPMAAFLDNLVNNPSRRVVEHLYAFLEHGKCPITEDGHFLTYKAVRGDFKDIHSGTFDNSVGQVVQMKRNRVDEDPDRTCSAGLHVCSFDYLPHFSHADGHVMVCKVNPADVVAIPRDYNNTKMRVCKYEVVSEYQGYYAQQGDVLACSTVASSEGEPFVVEVDTGDGFEVEESFAKLSQAAELMEDRLDDSDVRAARVVNSVTGQVLSSGENADFEGDDDADDFHARLEDPEYAVFGITGDGEAVELSSGFDSVADALSDALDYDDGTYVRLEVRNDSGEVVKTLS